ncbi:MAG: molecular chaperone GrpE [Candidatus Paceibacteria bacterium]|jgi:molecular chaperone GrpE
MVNNDNENNEEFEEITDELTDMTETEIEEIEDAEENKLKKVKDKLKQVEEDKRAALEELATVKADFLNARKRLEDDTKRVIERKTIRHMESLLPLADSFHMAMSNQEVWEKADENWRKGIEGINAQLLQILKDNGVTPVDPTGETFDPARHEAIGMTEVDENEVDTVVMVMQQGYEMTLADKTDMIRPARVTTGVAKS